MGHSLSCRGRILVIGRFFTDARQRYRTCYGVTDRRVLILEVARSRTLTAYALAGIPAVIIVEWPDGSGDLVLDASDASHAAVGGIVPRGMSVPPMLEFLSSPRSVYAVIRQAQRAL